MTANERFKQTKWAVQVCNKQHTITHTCTNVKLSVVSAMVQRCKLACHFGRSATDVLQPPASHVAPPSPMLLGPLRSKLVFGVGSIKTCVARSILGDFTFYPHFVGMPHTLFCGRSIASSLHVCVCSASSAQHNMPIIIVVSDHRLWYCSTAVMADRRLKVQSQTQQLPQHKNNDTLGYKHKYACVYVRSWTVVGNRRQYIRHMVTWSCNICHSSCSCRQLLLLP